MHEGILERYLYICTWPAFSISLQVINFDMRIEILALPNLHLVIYEGILEFDLYIYLNLVSLKNQPLTASSLPYKTNLHLDIYEGKLEFELYIFIWSASKIILH